MKNNSFVSLGKIGLIIAVFVPLGVHARNRKAPLYLSNEQKHITISRDKTRTYILCDSVKLDADFDIKNILTACINYKDVNRFLDTYLSSKTLFLFRYEELPIYNKNIQSKPDFNLYYRENKLVKYNINIKNEIGNIVIIIESIVVDHNHAIVNIRIPNEGVYGEFSLQKENSWLVKKANVYVT